ncbi:MAG: hypothetical protein Q9168_005506 [Polycauliona sp. 1 TL-2023]
MYAGMPNERQANEVSKSFHVNVTFVEGATSTVNKFLLQHRMSILSGDNDLSTWSRKRKLFPWAAIAAPLDHELSSGRLFSCLRLPIENGHPVHIHGLFSIVPDRGRLSSSGQTSKDMGSRWNHFMFKTCVVAAWTELLLVRSHVAWQQDLFQLWPRLNLSHSSELWASLDDHIFDELIAQNLPVWNTRRDCVAFEQGYFMPEGDLTQLYSAAFQAIKLPVVSLDLPMYQKLLQRASALSEEVQILTPERLRAFLKANDGLQQIKTYSPFLLQYCVLDFIDTLADSEKQTHLYNELQDIRLWPALQNSLISLRDGPTLLPRSADESALFTDSRKSETLNIGLLTLPVVRLLEKHVAKGSKWVRHRTVSDLGLDWPQIYSIDPASSNMDICVRSEQNDELLRSIWGWLYARCKEEGESPLVSMQSLDNLFLVPLNGSRIRRFVCSRVTSPTLILKDADWMRDLLSEQNSTATISADFILDSKILPPEAVQLVLSVASQRAALMFATSGDLKSLLVWLVANTDVVTQLSSGPKDSLVRQLSLLTLQQDQMLPIESKRLMKQHLLQLPIFRQVTAIAPYKSSSTKTATIGTSIRAIRMIEGLPPIPSIPHLVLFDPLDTHEANLLDFFDLLERMPLLDLFFEHIVPHIEDVEDPAIADAKLRLVHFVLEKNLRPSDNFQANFSKFKLVQSNTRSSSDAVQFRLPATTVDTTSPVSTLYFEEEDVFPDADFLERHHEVLKACGIIRVLTPMILMDRIHIFASSPKDKQQLNVKVKHLLSLPLDANFELLPTSLTQLRTLKWLPVPCSSSKGYQMVPPTGCRAIEDKELVDLVLCVFNTPVTPEWKALLGWNQAIEQETLMEQLDKSLAQCSSRRIDKTLACLSKLGDCSILERYPCILSRHGDYLLPKRVLLPGGPLSQFPLAPFLDEVEPSFARKHTQLLKELGVRQGITYDDLLQVQVLIVEATQSGKLSSEHLRVVVSLLEISTRLPADNTVSSLVMIPDTEGKLQPCTEIVCGERSLTGTAASFNFVNSKISPELVQSLGLETSHDRAMRLGIEIEDMDDEYAPHESLITTISDTLGRYTIDSTFSEFLANADDCGATQVSWILDACRDGNYESTTLLSKDLKELQGSALFVYNSGIFSDRDFQGFKDIGRGGKTDNETSTGMFGRGAMTMYHFTDVPMLISGSCFLILDPQQQLLPKKRTTWERKAGVKVPIDTARRLFPDQLRPFHGLHGFSMEEDSYNGTLYRLPFRSTDHTSLKETSALIRIDETEVLLEDYYTTAQMSLLFLKNVESVDFRVRGQTPSWSVTASRHGGSVDDTFQDIDITSLHQSGTISETSKAVWRTAITDIEQAPKELINPGRRANKVTECGLAARLNLEQVSTAEHLPNQVFCTLPTGFPLQLPMSVHASFAITGDRKTIPFEETKQKSAITAWNRWLLKECIPDLYIKFLKDLAPRLGEKVFDLWPSMKPVTSNQGFSDVIHEAFWSLLASERYESYQLFPVVEAETTIEQSTPLKTRASGRKRKLFDVTSLKAAQFDVLRITTSAKLSPLLSRVCPDWVRPRHLWRDIVASKIHLKVTVIESRYICDLFKTEANCAALETFLDRLGTKAAGGEATTTRDEAMKLLLQIAMPEHSSMDLMNGCRIIPMVDNSLRPIKFLSGDMESWSRGDLLFLPTPAEADLFALNAKSLIKSSFFHEDTSKQGALSTSFGTKAQTFKDPLLDLVTQSSNVREIGIEDINLFLEHVDASSVSHSTKGTWIGKFWAYLNPRLKNHHPEGKTMTKDASVSEQLQGLKLHDTPIYRYRGDASWHYITPQQFEKGPYIVPPIDRKEIDLCKLLPGVKVVDGHCLPLQLQHEESELNKPQAFSRLLKALTVAGTISTYIASDGVTPNTKLLRSLPIWPQHTPISPSTSAHCISAEEALTCAHGAVLLPWIQERHRFVDAELVDQCISTLQSLGCTIMDIDSIWKHLEPSLPQTLSASQLNIYLPCIEHLAGTNWKPQSKIAPNGHGTLCAPSSLFDHEDQIFVAAFGLFDKDHFPHPNFRSKRLYWKSLGLRSRSSTGAMNDSDFKQCIASIQARLKTTTSAEQDRRDAAKLTEYLRFVRPGFESWSGGSWTYIVQARIYQASTDVVSEPNYRQNKMLSVASNVGPCSIQYATSSAHMRVIWSQRPLLEDPPDAHVYKFVDMPQVSTVFEHLQHLISIRGSVSGPELSQYLKDLQATYDFLQKYPEASARISGIRDAMIWLNLPSTDLASISTSQLDGALRSAKTLCFNAPLDTHVVERAKNFLIPYESLLAKLGCQKMVRPARPQLAARSDNQRPMDQNLSVIRDMQKKGHLTDITFEVEGRRISAHKVFMAAVSEKCQRQLLGAWGELISNQSTIKTEDLTAKTLQYIVDFAYTGEVNWPVLRNAEDIDEVADKLDELLDLLRGADKWVVEALHDLTERYLLDQAETYVRPDNVDSVKEAAEEAQAKHLVKHCEEYIRANSQFVQDCRDMK